MRPVALLTDFGLADEYVGVMKGVMLATAPGLVIVDLCHGIAAGNVRQAAMLLAASYLFFPENTVHVCVVDPGVGSGRRIVALASGQRIFLAPDNGLLTPVIDADPDAAAWSVTHRGLFLAAVSHTFHGRDIFAPVAARLAAGLPLREVGHPLPLASLVTIVLPAARNEGGQLHGEIVAIDRFGNCTTSIGEHDLRLFADGEDDLLIRCGDHVITGLGRHYHGPPATPIALINSRGFVEIAIARGHAATLLGLAEGTSVVIGRIGKKCPSPPRFSQTPVL